MTDKEKDELKTLLEMGHITQDYYDFMLAGEPQAAEVTAGDTHSSNDFQFPPLPDAAEWHIAADGKQSGPFNKSTLTDMLISGKMTRQSQIWKKGMASWVQAEDVTELSDLWDNLPPVLPQSTAPQSTVSAEDAFARLLDSQGDLSVNLDISEAALGTTVDVRTPYRTLRFSVPTGIKDGQKFRIKGQGAPKINGGGNGDLYITLHIRDA